MADDGPCKKTGRFWKERLSVCYGILAAAKQHGMKQRTSGRVAIVVVEDATKTRPFFDDAFASSHTIVYMNDVAIQALMVSLCMVVLHILLNGKAKMFLSKGNDLAQTLGLDGQDEAFCESIQIRTSRGQSHRLRAAILENVPETSAKQRVSVHNEILSVVQKSVEVIGKITGHLLHPDFAGLIGNANDRNLSRLKAYHE